MNSAVAFVALLAVAYASAHAVATTVPASTVVGSKVPGGNYVYTVGQPGVQYVGQPAVQYVGQPGVQYVGQPTVGYSGLGYNGLGLNNGLVYSSGYPVSYTAPVSGYTYTTPVVAKNTVVGAPATYKTVAAPVTYTTGHVGSVGTYGTYGTYGTVPVTGLNYGYTTVA